MFQISRALLTNQYLAYDVGVNFTIRLPEIRKATASILYVNAVSPLDEAAATKLSSDERRRRLKGRLIFLRDKGELLDFVALDAIRKRRNEIAHQTDKEATVKELGDACSVIQRQLVAWGLVSDVPKYDITFERSQMRGGTSPGIASEHDRIIRVMNGTSSAFESKATVQFHNLSDGGDGNPAGA